METQERPSLAGRHPSVISIMKWFRSDHLPPRLRLVAGPVEELAWAMVMDLPDGPELVSGLRKLLEGKDCLVRAELDRTGERVIAPTAQPVVPRQGGRPIIHANGAEDLARHFHDFYEELAPRFGYETRQASRKAFDDVPVRNAALMVAVCAELLGQDWPRWVGQVAEGVRLAPDGFTDSVLETRKLLEDEDIMAREAAESDERLGELERKLEEAKAHPPQPMTGGEAPYPGKLAELPPLPEKWSAPLSNLPPLVADSLAPFADEEAHGDAPDAPAEVEGHGDAADA